MAGDDPTPPLKCAKSMGLLAGGPAGSELSEPVSFLKWGGCCLVRVLLKPEIYCNLGSVLSCKETKGVERYLARCHGVKQGNREEGSGASAQPVAPMPTVRPRRMPPGAATTVPPLCLDVLSLKQAS